MITIDKSRCALIVVDVQNDFCPGGSLEVLEGDQVAPVINRIAPMFSRVVATQDWHPPNHISFASNHKGGKPFDLIDIKGVEQVLWPAHCVFGTAGADFCQDLDTNFFDIIIRKGQNPELDSYSAFFENDSLTPTGLAPYLKGLGLEQVFLTGLATDVCVFFSAMDAVRLGFEVYLVEDAARGIDSPPGSLKERISEMKDAGVQIIRSVDLE
ncbi:MAG: bifunctional nicotinamidase/pyrazinamidase [Spirochaetota bacterium]|nr:bifunctional nicotinamidase/pyrazinamidase [Spirochaetota bacterium]